MSYPAMDTNREAPLPKQNVFRYRSNSSKRDSVASEVSGESPFGAQRSTLQLEEESMFELDPLLDSQLTHYKIPQVMVNDGLPFTKVSHKSRKQIWLRVDASDFRFLYLKSENTSLASINSNGNAGRGGKIKSFGVEDIKAIASDRSASNFREELCISKEAAERWLTIIYYDHSKQILKTLHLIANSPHDLRKLLSVIESLITLRSVLAKKFFIDLKDVNTEVLVEDSREKRKFLTFNDVIKYSKRLNISISINYLKQLFDSVANVKEDSNDVPGIDFEEFKTFVQMLVKREAVEDLHNTHTSSSQGFNFDSFKAFITQEQKEVFSERKLESIFRNFAFAEEFDTNLSSINWTPESLNNFLLSKYSSPFKGFHETQKYFDHPLHHYFISSLHNTYLMGRQVAGDSSIEGYVRTLQRGCRCVEIDVWDGEYLTNDGEKEEGPVVSHGRTLTTTISFINVIKTIKRYAFVTSPYPVILSLELHCSSLNQLKMVEILQNVLGDALVSKCLDTYPELPSPASLKYKVLVKVKKLNSILEIQFGDSGGSSTTSTSFSEDSNSNSSGLNRKFSLKRKKAATVIAELSNLGCYLQGTKFRNFSLPESKTFNHIFSFGEKAINKMLKDPEKLASLDKHNRKFMSRVYPSGLRFSSSNFIPLIYWNHGCQMVATNWQTYDLGQQINESMFDAYDRMGYVLKPNELLKPVMKKTLRRTSSHRKTKFSINIISAHQLPKLSTNEKSTLDSNCQNEHQPGHYECGSIASPSVQLEFYGTDKLEWDKDSNSQSRTATIQQNGFNPVWNEEFKGTFTASHSFVFIRFMINSLSPNKSDEYQTIGLFVLKFDSLKQGYRYLPIYDLSGEEFLYSSLFVKIKYEDIEGKMGFHGLHR
ncbi:Phospholipase C [Scheffersomyces spartinae]|uniref:Phosphoinositide phospholipase C n=1 Tax=Scheffersomyces spartinae TaxID=45513 RepID=A0A9P7V4V9_9ASCO|nr:Phospholipase C [Scheffersomyces spartinae]KAG7191294.1 Phospholipase C [Scheffersomyces spartinae]